MRAPSLLFILLFACTNAEKERAGFLDEATEAEAAGDWDRVLELLEDAVRTDPINLDARLRLADLYLVAYNDPDKARDLYFRASKRSEGRALHGLGRCALWDGEEAVGREYLRRSIAADPTVACAIDLAARTTPGEREELLKLQLAGRRWQLFLKAFDAQQVDVKAPQERSYALARARLATGKERDAQLLAHLADVCADDAAQRAYAQVLLGETLFRRNPALFGTVTRGD